MFRITLGETTLSISDAGQQVWYQDGNWPLIGAVLTLAASNAVAVLIAQYQQSSSRRHNLDAERRRAIESRLQNFYDPLLALLKENEEVFRSFGPQSYSQADHIEAEVAYRYWERIKSDFIRPNNKKISEIIQRSSHNITEGDNLSIYMKLKLHIDAYAIFEDIPSERYESFMFPTDVLPNINEHRQNLIDELKRMQK